MLSEMQPPPTQAIKGYVELLAVAELHSTTTFIVMIIAHNPAIVNHFPKIYSGSQAKNKEKDLGASIKGDFDEKFRFIEAILAHCVSKFKRFCEYIFRTIASHSSFLPAIRKLALADRQTPDIFR